MYKQAGNSIVVDVMLAIVREIIKTGVFDSIQTNSLEVSEIEYSNSSFIEQLQLKDCI